MGYKDVYQIIHDANVQCTELLGRELGQELTSFGEGLGCVAIMKRNYTYLKQDYKDLRESYEQMAKDLEKLELAFQKLKSEKADWK